MMVLGIVGTSAWQTERILVMKPGETTSVAGYSLTFRGVAPEQGPNYNAVLGVFDVQQQDNDVIVLRPGRRVYDKPPMPTSEAGIHASWRGDLYVILGDSQTAGGYSVRIYFYPLVRLIWIGSVVMFLGGALSLSDRRLRVGAPTRARPRGPQLAPAE
jgi:cytochrome c-type biogenesis protein CcmF